MCEIPGVNNSVTHLFVLFIHCLSKLLLEQHNNLLDVLARDHLQSNAKGLPANVNVGTGKNTKNFHGQVIQDTLITSSQVIHTVQYDKLDIVVSLPNGELDQFARCGFHGDRVTGKGSK